jgi:NitT/TauT family transport system ATP-binding protein
VKLSIRGVTKRYASGRTEVEALSAIDFGVAEGEFVSLVGPSGCGKSTLLHVVAGLEPASSGDVTLDGEVVRGPGAELGVVFQKQTLFPWLSVWDNVRFPHTLRRHRAPSPSPVEEQNRVTWVENLLRLVGLWEFRNSFPAELSGGMQQRAAIARALLMDEPFGALDSQTREEMQELTLHLTRHHRTTTLFVTHDVDEALLLSDRVLVFSARPGRIIAEVPVEFERGSRTAELKLSPEFVEMKRALLAHFRARAAGSVERQGALRGLVETET